MSDEWETCTVYQTVDFQTYFLLEYCYYDTIISRSKRHLVKVVNKYVTHNTNLHVIIASNDRCTPEVTQKPLSHGSFATNPTIHPLRQRTVLLNFLK